MPPSKVKIERIAGDRTRQNTFHKRKLGLIKKAIELTVLCDCECAIILRSGPTVMCQEGRLSAYCNKDLEKMLKDCLAEMPMEYYTNDEYARLSKDGESVVEQPSTQEPVIETTPSIEVDIESGTHSVPSAGGVPPPMDKAQELRLRMAAMEAELRALQQSLGPDSSSRRNSIMSVQEGSPQISGRWPSPEVPSPPQSGSPGVEGKGKVRKRAPPPLTSFGAQQQGWHGQQDVETGGENSTVTWEDFEREGKRRCSGDAAATQHSIEFSELYQLTGSLDPSHNAAFAHYVKAHPSVQQAQAAARPDAPAGPASSTSLASGFFHSQPSAAPAEEDCPLNPSRLQPKPDPDAAAAYGGAPDLPSLSPSAATWDLSHIFPSSPAHLTHVPISPSSQLKSDGNTSPGLLALHTPIPGCPLLPFGRGVGGM